MFEALDLHEQPLDHGSRMRNTHLFGCTPHVGLFPIKDPLHQQLVQNAANVPHPCHPVLHPASTLHPGKPDEIAEVEVVGLVVIPVFPLAVDPLNQGVGSGVGTSIHDRTVGQAGVCHPGHTGDGALAVATRHVVAVEVVAWHDELGGWECW